MVKLFKNWKNKKTLLFLGFLFLTLFLFWPLPALAVIEAIANVILTVPYILISLVLILGVLISWGFAWLTGAILDIVISPAFVSLSYTDPAKNQIIATGLNITQSFVNLLLVVALVYTALAMALRINETEAKKTLVRLIIVALLVNFVPVFCGLVVDAANIVMYYFLEPIEGGVSGVLTQIGTLKDMVIHAVEKVVGTLPQRLGVIMMAVTQIIVNFAMGVAFFLFAGIFLVRYIAIWALVILAPLAFVCWIVPQTKDLWSKWLNNFVQWSIIGIPIAFFLYLAMGSFGIISGVFKGKVEIPGMEATAVGYLNEVFPFFVVIVFLILGFIIGLATTAMGAAATINLTKRVGVWGARTAGRVARRSASRVLGAKGKEWAEKQASARFMPEKIREMKGLKGVAAKAGYYLTTPVTGTFWALRRGLGEAGLRLTEAGIKDIGTAEEKYKRTIAERKMTGIRDALRLKDFGKAAGILRQAIEEEQISDLRTLGLKDEEIIKVGKEALRLHPEQFKKIRDAFPQLAKEMSEGFNEDIRKAAGLVLTNEEKDKGMTLPMKIMVRIKPEFIPKIDELAQKSRDIQDFFHNHATTAQVAAFLEKGDREAKDLYINTARILGYQHYEKINPGLANYFKSNPGIRALGGPLPETPEPKGG